MVKLGLGFIVVGLLVGCVSKKEKLFIESYTKKQNYYKYLQRTEKADFKENSLTKFMITATYINEPNIDMNDKSKEKFIIGIHDETNTINSVDGDKISIELYNVLTKDERIEKRDEKRALMTERRKELRNLNLKDINTTLQKYKDEDENNKIKKYVKPMEIKRISSDSELLNGISFSSDWTKFYLLTFKHIPGNRLSLRVKSKKSEAELILEKNKLAKAKAKAKAKSKSSKKRKLNYYNIRVLNFSKVSKYSF